MVFFAPEADQNATATTDPDDVKRIVSLAPNLTEILFALGLEQEIVGVTRYSDYPPAASPKE